jgi:2-hydroxychromene-2-carboxylate isomerase
MKKFSLLLLSLALACPAFAQKPAAGRPAQAKTASGARLDLYLEAMDGQGWQWLFLSDAVRHRLEGVELRVYPLVTKGADGAFSAARGEPELAEALRLAVLLKDYPGRQLAYLSARSLTPSAEGWRDAALFAGINPDELEKRVASEGRTALEAAYKVTSAAGVSGSALFLNGKHYEGSQRLMSLYDAVNAALPPSRRMPLPAGYKPKPPPPPPGLWVVLSTGTKSNEALLTVFGRYFEGIKPVTLDYDSAERRARFPSLEFVPAYVLSGTPEARARLDNELKAGLFRDASGYLIYEDRQSRGVYAARPAAPGTLEVYVMSNCPFGVMAENSLLEAQKNKLLPEGTKLAVHYIGDAKKDEKGAYEFSSLHGPGEWQEDARQLYIAKYFPDKLDAYLLERNKEITSPDWQKAAAAVGIDAARVDAGAEEGKALLAADFAASSELGITTSPSFMVDGRQFMVGLGELIKTPGYEKVPPPGQPAAGCNK